MTTHIIVGSEKSNNCKWQNLSGRSIGIKRRHEMGMHKLIMSHIWPMYCHAFSETVCSNVLNGIACTKISFLIKILLTKTNNDTLHFVSGEYRLLAEISLFNERMGSGESGWETLKAARNQKSIHIYN